MMLDVRIPSQLSVRLKEEKKRKFLCHFTYLTLFIKIQFNLKVDRYYRGRIFLNRTKTKALQWVPWYRSGSGLTDDGAQ